MPRLTFLIAATILAVAPMALIFAAETKAYDLLFRTGTLDAIDRDTELIYRRTVHDALDPQAAARRTGEIALTIGPGAPAMARLDFRQDGRHRPLGRFPASVGNPMIMYFYESVIRDMAASAGGSPFYIRNRVKEILTRPGAVETAQMPYDGDTITVRTVRLRPFARDPNRDRMRGFGDLELRVSMSEAVPGWYLSLVAESADPAGQGAPVYRSELRFDRVQAAQ